MSSEYEQYKKERQDLVESRRLKEMTPDGGAGLITSDESVRIVPKTFKEKWDNYWYHYKMLTFGIAFVAVLVICFACQMIFRVHYDTNIIFVSEYPVDIVRADTEEGWKQFVVDKTQNGKIDLMVNPLQFDTESKYGDQNPNLVQASYVKLSGHLSSLDGFVFVTDEHSYDFLTAQEVDFLDMSELVSDSDKIGLDGKGYKLGGTEAGKFIGFSDEFLENYYVCFLNPDSYGARLEKEKYWEIYQADLQFMKNLIAYG